MKRRELLHNAAGVVGLLATGRCAYGVDGSAPKRVLTAEDVDKFLTFPWPTPSSDGARINLATMAWGTGGCQRAIVDARISVSVTSWRLQWRTDDRSHVGEVYLCGEKHSRRIHVPVAFGDSIDAISLHFSYAHNEVITPEVRIELF